MSKRCNTIKVGKNYFVRTVTHHYVGCCVEVSEDEVALDNASWVADDGHFSDAMGVGSLLSVSPYPKEMVVTLNRSSFIDSVEWPYPLPTKDE